MHVLQQQLDSPCMPALNMGVAMKLFAVLSEIFGRKSITTRMYAALAADRSRHATRLVQTLTAAFVMHCQSYPLMKKI